MQELRKEENQTAKLKSEKQKGNLLRHGTSLSVLTFVSRILGLIREMTKSSFMGTTPMADAFSIAFLIPNLLRRLFAENSITVAFIPTFQKYIEKESSSETNQALIKNETREFLSSIFTLLSFCTVVIVTLGIIFTPIILRLFFPSIEEEFDLTVLLTRIMFPYLTFISTAAFFQGILNGVKVFSPSGFTPILFNIIIIGSTYLLTGYFDNAGIAMSIGVTAGGIIQALFQLPFVLKTPYRFSLQGLKKSLSNPGTKQVVALLVPTLFGMAAYQVNDVISSTLARYAGTGILSSLQYSMRLQEVLLGVFAVSVGTVILPDLSAYATQKNWEKFQSVLSTAIQAIAFITIPATFFSLLSGEHIISLVFKARSFTSDSVRLTLDAFNFHIMGLFFIALNRIISPAFYALGNSKLPAMAGIISVVVNILAALLLISPMKGGGLALALTIASIANTILLFIFLRKVEALSLSKLLKRTFVSMLKMSLFSVVACVPLFLFGSPIYAKFQGHSRFISEGIPLFIHFIIFSAITLFLLSLTDDPLLNIVLEKLKLKKPKSNV